MKKDKETFAKEFSRYMNPPQEPDTGKAVEQEVRKNVLAMEIIRDQRKTAELRAEVTAKLLNPDIFDKDDLNKILGYINELIFGKESEE